VEGRVCLICAQIGSKGKVPSSVCQQTSFIYADDSSDLQVFFLCNRSGGSDCAWLLYT